MKFKPQKPSEGRSLTPDEIAEHEARILNLSNSMFEKATGLQVASKERWKNMDEGTKYRISQERLAAKESITQGITRKAPKKRVRSK